MTGRRTTGSTGGVELLSRAFRWSVGGTFGVAACVVLVAVLSSGTPDSFVPTVLAVVCLALGAVWALRAAVVVRADDAGVSVGMRRWPVYRFRWDEVEAVRRVNVSAWEHGGLGYRITGRRSRAILARSGPGVRFDLTGGRTVVVATRHADELVARARRSDGDRRAR